MLPKSAKMVLIHLLLFILLISTAVKAQTEAEVAEASTKAAQLIENEQFAAAIPYLEILIKSSPNNPKIRFFYGYSLLMKSKQIENNEEAKKLSAKALEELKKAKSLGLNEPTVDALISLLSGEGTAGNETGFSKNAEANKLMNQAENNFAQSKYDEAIEFYGKALAIDPNLYEAALYSGDSYMQKKDWENAEKWYQKAITINPNRETAYRYSATPLMKKAKDETETQARNRYYDQARDRYIEALITEPYSQSSPRGISQWAEATGAKLGHPKIDIPEIKFDESGKPLMSAPVNDANYAKNWQNYVSTRVDWKKTKFAQTFPNEKQYRHSLQEEADAIRNALKFAKEQKLSHPQFDILQKLDNEGLLEAFILMAQADEGIAEDHEAYLKNNRPKLRQYVLNYVIQK